MRISWSLVASSITLCCIHLHAAESPAGGIGIALGVDKDSPAVKVIRGIPDTPASRAGLSPGMVLYSIDGKDIDGKNLADCVSLIRGPVGTKLKMGLIDPRAHTTNVVELERAQITAAGKARLGDPAAPLFVKEWVQGGPIDVKDGKSVYVVEFWATWCGPCRVSIPHLSALQKKLKDKGVVVVGVSDEEPAKVKPFVKSMGEKMDYAVACDDTAQSNMGYMAAYGFNGIPTAFIVDKQGKVRWAGHPMAGLDQALEKVLAGNSAN